MKRVLIAVVVGLAAAGVARGQVEDQKDGLIAKIPVNYTEAKVGTFTMPDILKMEDGRAVTDAKMWNEQRRPEIVKWFEENQYGKCPGRPADMTFDVFDQGTPAFEGKAIRRQVTIYFSKDRSGPYMDVVVYVPANAKGPVPVLLNASFVANNLTVDDPGVKVGRAWNAQQNARIPAVPAPPGAGRGRGRGAATQAGGQNQNATTQAGAPMLGAATQQMSAGATAPIAAGTQGATTAPRRPGPFGVNVLPILEKGIGFATVNYADIDPDALGAIPFGVRALYLKPGQTEPAADEWGSIGAWAWGLSRAMDYFETDASVDAKRVGIMGVSRLGKTVLWAGGHDQRFSLVIASCGGEGGAALSRRNYGETIAHLVAEGRYPYQFCANYAKRAAHPEESPMDSHMLVALMAPRALLLQTGSTDGWSDPKGEFLAAVAAGPTFEFLGAKGLGTDIFPPAGTPIFHDLGYFMHVGGHGTVPSDWEQFLAFMGMHWKVGG